MDALSINISGIFFYFARKYKGVHKHMLGLGGGAPIASLSHNVPMFLFCVQTTLEMNERSDDVNGVDKM